MTPEALGPFNRRFRLVVEIRDDQDEREPAEDLLAAQVHDLRVALGPAGSGSSADP
ncbi:hypothetical protein ACIHIX_07495 [Streptomyces sp. NPDC051913]|uniref:hypothetical protein n=1 Tax=Streptomyces sp. NPDC051913 TaxID=3365676 RepID=UPI0037D3499D